MDENAGGIKSESPTRKLIGLNLKARVCWTQFDLSMSGNLMEALSSYSLRR